MSKYPGRGIIIGKTSNADAVIQIYWIMGRSENSRNRVFKLDDNNFVKTEAFNLKKLSDPSLIIYYPVKAINNYHIVTNGDHTETIFKYLQGGKSFEASLAEQLFEPDVPNFTPRISGLVNIQKKEFKLSIVKTISNNENYFTRQVFSYNELLNGKGYCITTYEKEGDPLPSYMGEPQVVDIYDTIDENLEMYWDVLDSDNKISLLVKSISMKDGSENVAIINKLTR